MVDHRSLVNLCCWHNRFYGITETDRAAQYASFGFDASVWEVFPYLLAGASVYTVPEDIRLDIFELNGFFEQHGITSAFLPTRMCAQFVVLPNHGLKRLLTGGEQMSRGTRPGPGTCYTLYNNYGPTETTVVSAIYTVRGMEDDVPIGKPIDNTQVNILDKVTGQLLPIGAAGELFIAGDGVSRGYINDVERTFKTYRLLRANISDGLNRFDRTYCSGDMARWLNDGNIQFLGRLDGQVKIRGFRIELGEIEKRLTAHPAIIEAAVLVGREANDDPYLCAFFVPKKGERTDALNALTDLELKHYLSFSLPGYMIPSYFVSMDKIPLTGRGKIDRGALPFPGQGERTSHYTPPENETQKRLVDIWAEILGMEFTSLGIDDNFFNRGGHSLKVAALVTKIRDEWGVKIPLARIFQEPTIRGQARYIDRDRFIDEGSSAAASGRAVDEQLVLLREGNGNGLHLFFIHDGSGGVGEFTPLAAGMDPVFTCWGIRAETMETYVPRALTIEEIAREYIAKITYLQPRGPYFIIGRCIGGTIGFEMVRQLETTEETVDFFGVVNSPVPRILSASGVQSAYANLCEMQQDIEQRDDKELFYYQSLVRVYSDARDSYVPVGKIETTMHYIIPREGEISGKEDWNRFCTRPVRFFPVEGNHFSIFKPPYVKGLAGIFNRLIKKNLAK